MADVILVEDNGAVRKSLADYLAVAGHEVSEAESAVELYQLLSGQNFDVAVVDINLPHHSGFSITQYLSENRLCSVIITTVRDAVEDRVRGYQCGADIYMVKPVEPEELSAAIARLADKRRAKAEAGQPAGEKWIFDKGNHGLWAPNGSLVALTPREVRLVEAVLDVNGVLSREAMLQRLGEDDSREGRARLDTMLSRLRAKVRRVTRLELPLMTAHNAGFGLLAPIERN